MNTTQKEFLQNNTHLKIIGKLPDKDMIAAENQVYISNQYAFDLEKLRLMKEILDDKSTFYFIPEGTDITMLWNPSSVVPVPTEAK